MDIPWGWGGNGAFLDICEIEVDRSDSKGFVMLTFDTTPNYTDTTPFPATPTKWTYRAIYRVGFPRRPVEQDRQRDGRRVAKLSGRKESRTRVLAGAARPGSVLSISACVALKKRFQ